jgi:hypothetical protein
VRNVVPIPGVRLPSPPGVAEERARRPSTWDMSASHTHTSGEENNRLERLSEMELLYLEWG